MPRSKPPQGFLHFPHSTSPEGRMLAWRRDSEGPIDSNRPRDVETEPAARAPSLQRLGRAAPRVPERDNLHSVKARSHRAGPREGVAGHTLFSATFSRCWRRRTRSRKGRRREWSKRELNAVWVFDGACASTSDGRCKGTTFDRISRGEPTHTARSLHYPAQTERVGPRSAN